VKVIPSPSPSVPTPTQAAAPQGRPHANTIDELGELLNNLEPPRSKPSTSSHIGSPYTPAAPSYTAPASTPSYGQQPLSPVPAPTPVLAQAQAAPSMDDLDELLNNLEPPRASVTPVKPSPSPAYNSTPAYNTPSYNNSTPSYNNPTPSYNNPTPSYNNPTPSYNNPTPSYNNPTPSYNNPPSYNNSTPAYNSTPTRPANNTPSRPSPASPPFVAPSPAKNEKRAAPLAGDDLDNLISNLTSQISDIDNSGPTARGTCAQCRKPILGEVIQALGKTFHPEHFACGNCQNPLGTNNFYEQDGVPHCERCYQELFCARCAHCDEPILDRCVTAIGKKWHINHFICTQCLSPFENGTFFERDSRPYCETCFYAAFAPRCAGCNQSIKGECVNALGQQWHPEHFVCQYCQKNFSGGSFFEFGGKPYCETHYHQQTGSLCAGCGKAVTSKCVSALDKKWHPEHFVCAFCMNPLAGGSFTENNGKAYCKECHGKLFG